MLPRPWTRLVLWEIWPCFQSFCRSEIYYSSTLRSIAILSLSLIVPRSDNPQISSAVRVISCLLNGKIRCRSGVCKCICGFPRCGHKSLRHQRARRRQFIRSLKLCGDIFQVTRRRNGASVRIPPTTVHKCEPRATRSLAKPHAVGARLKIPKNAIVPSDARF
ncbi:hypothetical protein AVEN_80235-1 [Araneus ventricosus]|uniref:Uncharacterized protein n=1 Tax=Araneus ventricosus TaxID=182803 RepID=A0A4Y2PHE8_ARAVE|nr:hypothetical protein AVEN_80235-1 [Araneus ventricosus]